MERCQAAFTSLDISSVLVNTDAVKLIIYQTPSCAWELYKPWSNRISGADPGIRLGHVVIQSPFWLDLSLPYTLINAGWYSYYPLPYSRLFSLGFSPWWDIRKINWNGFGGTHPPSGSACIVFDFLLPGAIVHVKERSNFKLAKHPIILFTLQLAFLRWRIWKRFDWLNDASDNSDWLRNI